MLLKKPGYIVEAAQFGQMIFVSSKLPEDERAKVVEALIEKQTSKSADSALL